MFLIEIPGPFPSHPPFSFPPRDEKENGGNGTGIRCWIYSVFALFYFYLAFFFFAIAEAGPVRFF